MLTCKVTLKLFTHHSSFYVPSHCCSNEMLLVGQVSTSLIYLEVNILGETSYHDEFNEEAAKVKSRVLKGATDILFF